MAPRGWFDSEKLLPGERLARAGTARLCIDGPPHWWEGRLILTSERLFFLPHTAAALVEGVAFWLADVLDARPAGGGRLRVRVRNAETTFDLAGAPFASRRVRGWTRDIGRLRGGASLAPPLRDPRRAAG